MYLVAIFHLVLEDFGRKPEVGIARKLADVVEARVPPKGGDNMPMCSMKRCDVIYRTSDFMLVNWQSGTV